MRCTEQPVFEKQKESVSMSHNYTELLNLCNVLALSQWICGHTFIIIIFEFWCPVSDIPSDTKTSDKSRVKTTTLTRLPAATQTTLKEKGRWDSIYSTADQRLPTALLRSVN